jgi:hypothetical protein
MGGPLKTKTLLTCLRIPDLTCLPRRKRMATIGCTARR